MADDSKPLVKEATDERKRDREQLAEAMENWRWQVAECFGSTGITEPERRRLLNDLDAGIQMLRGANSQSEPQR